MIPNSRTTFVDFCRRALGEPVIQLNVDPTQVDDRVDEALYVYQQYHMDAVQKDYLKHEITASTFTFATDTVGTFLPNELVNGANSNASGEIISVANTTTATFFNSGKGIDFQVGETVSGSQSGATGVISAIALGDMDLHYFDIDDSIIYVNRIFPPFDLRLYSDILFDPQAQFNISLLSNFTNNSMVPYVLGRQYQQLLSDMFRGRPEMRFQRHQNRIYVDVGFVTSFRPGQFIIAECFRTLDPDTYTDVWTDRWLQRYATALIKRQWGTNMKKYTGIALPGGIALDGQTIYNEAEQEIKDLEQQLHSEFTLPIDIVIG